VARDASRLLRQAIDRRIRVIVQPTEGAWTALADMDQMHQVIMNLCVNARDSLNERMSAKNGRPLPDGWEPRIVIAVENVNVDEAHCRLHYDARPGEYVCVSVTDNGSGIDEAIRDRIFEPFFTTKEIGHGTGLGLATVYGILKQHGGWIELASDKTVGSSFRCYLPRLEEAAESPSPETADTSIPRGHETVLFVDDESSIRQLAQSILENSGYTVLPAENGEQALDIFQRELRRIGLVILDLTMPALSGRDVLRRILAIDPKMRILISSGHQIPNDGNQLRSLGRIEFVPKPYRPDELARSVRSILDRVYTDG